MLQLGTVYEFSIAGKPFLATVVAMDDVGLSIVIENGERYSLEWETMRTEGITFVEASQAPLLKLAA